MPTRSGWATLLAGIATVVLGRLFGILELFVVGTTLVAAVAAAWLVVRFRAARVRVGRLVSPRRVHAGETARVEIVASNSSDRRTPVLELRDPVSNTQGAYLQLAPLAGSASAHAAYRLPTSARGHLEIGPMTISRTDMLGLCRRRMVAAPVAYVTVLPRWEHVEVPGGGADLGPLGQHLRLRALGRDGDEFRTLREYVPGDDRRRISWKASARSEDLIVREMDVAGLKHLAVVLDQTAEAHSPESFERAVSAAASIVISAVDAGRTVQFTTGDGLSLVPSANDMDALLEHLALARATTSGSPVQAIEGLGSRLAGGLLVLVGGRVGPELLSRLRGAAGADATVAVSCEGPLPPPMPGVFFVDATTDDRFAPSWNRLVGRQGSSASTVPS